MRMSGLSDNSITPDDAARAYEILGFRGHQDEYRPPARLDLASMMETAPLLELYERARAEHEQGGRGGLLGGLTEYRAGLELVSPSPSVRLQTPPFRLTEITRGRPNHAGREIDRSRTIVGTLHTHPWDVSQSIGDVRNLLRTNDLLGGVMTYTGRIFLLVKHPDTLDGRRGPFEQEWIIQRASLQGAPDVLGAVGLLGALSASFDLPIQATRDPYIRSLAKQLGLLYYAGDVRSLVLDRG
jgi:hypothetical protein